MNSTAARARIYKNPGTGRWTVDMYWRGLVIGQQQRRSWDEALTYAMFWTNA